MLHQLGFFWVEGTIPAAQSRSIDHATTIYRKNLVRLVTDACALEDNPLPHSDIFTLANGYSVGGHKIEYVLDAVRLLDAAKDLLYSVRSDRFRLDAGTLLELHRYAVGRPLSVYGQPDQSDAIDAGGKLLRDHVADPRTRAFAFFLFVVLHEFAPSRNLLIARMMMNGELMSNGIDPITIPKTKAEALNQLLDEFRVSLDGTDVIEFLADCNLDDIEDRRRRSRAGAIRPY